MHTQNTTEGGEGGGEAEEGRGRKEEEGGKGKEEERRNSLGVDPRNILVLN